MLILIHALNRKTYHAFYSLQCLALLIGTQTFYFLLLILLFKIGFSWV
ncbi:hypothetical protein PULV_b0968 [Pseudoalteromonas ulvae UL12]|nr:hypothetical protein [Pseudoalteromonas ulvae UL12]